MDIVFVCSPFSDSPAAVRIAKQYCRKLALTGAIPIAPHLFFSTFLQDIDSSERQLGIMMGRRLMHFCTRIDILEDDGITKTMLGDIAYAESLKLPQKRITEL